MPKSPSKSALLIAGPTASGKSALALRLARERGGVIINADSMQVYRELRILSARPTSDEEAHAPHRLYGHVSGSEDYSVGRWLADAKSEITAAWEQGATPLIVGGTGLYFMALMGGLAEVPPIPKAVRDAWRNFEGDPHAELAKRDPQSAAKLNPSDKQRIIRALEVFDGTGHTLGHWQALAQNAAFLNENNTERLFVNVEREVLYTRAERRFDLMMEQGALDEVKALPPLPVAQPIMKAIGVPELRAYLNSETSLDDAITSAKTATRNYIKRQLTWWRGQMKGWQSVTSEGKQLP
jgi:tRNA dimethylallyltransferase